MQLIVYETVNTVLLAEAVKHVVTVFPDALQEVTRHADIQRPVAFTRQNIDRRLLAHTAPLLDSRFRGNDDLVHSKL